MQKILYKDYQMLETKDYFDKAQVLHDSIKRLSLEQDKLAQKRKENPTDIEGNNKNKNEMFRLQEKTHDLTLIQRATGKEAATIIAINALKTIELSEYGKAPTTSNEFRNFVESLSTKDYKISYFDSHICVDLDGLPGACYHYIKRDAMTNLIIFPAMYKDEIIIHTPDEIERDYYRIKKIYNEHQEKIKKLHEELKDEMRGLEYFPY